MSSRQEQRYLELRRNNVPQDDAEFQAGLLPGEAAMIDAAVARGDLEIPTESAPEEISQKPQSSAADWHDSTPEEITPAAGAAAPQQESDMAVTVAADELRLFIERIERLEENKRGIADDIKDVYAEAKGRGFEPKIMREIVKERAMDKDKRDEREALLDTYRHALGMLADLPLGQAAMARAA